MTTYIRCTWCMGVKLGNLQFTGDYYCKCPNQPTSSEPITREEFNKVLDLIQSLVGQSYTQKEMYLKIDELRK